jgi:glycosyltransferase involved in cell wall biosynthesis
MRRQNQSALFKSLKPELLERLVKLNRRNIAVYSIISINPPVLYIPRFASKITEFTDSFRILFDYLKAQSANILYVHYSAVTLRQAEEIAELEAEHRRQYPTFDFIHLCNYRKQLERLQALGLKTVFCNHNAFVDEKIYKPLANADKIYDAVYDARLVPFKRHHLAAELGSLGLVYYSVPTEDEPKYAEEIKRNFGHAKFFNHSETGEYQRMSGADVNRALNQCRVGLCLSAQEGAMFASVQYLLAGLPVVTTVNTGGRDEFFDRENSITVDADPEAVKRGVEEMIARNLNPEHIRQKTLERMKVHRRRFISLVQGIYDGAGIERKFSTDWSSVFFNKMAKNQKHVETIEMFRTGDFGDV